MKAIRKLAAWHRAWFRLEGSDQLDPNTNNDRFDIEYILDAFPAPIEKAPDPPLTGIRASPASGSKMDFVVLTMAANTFMQVVLCYFMWGQNRFVRPSWATGVFVAIGCISAGVGGIVQCLKGKRIKSIEGFRQELAKLLLW